MSLQELRQQLITVAMAYKGERMRNDQFEKKLVGAIRQLERREKLESALADLQSKNVHGHNKLNLMANEK